MEKNIKNIIKKASRTYFYSSLFFPRQIKQEVFTLYAFVRIADDYVDHIPQDINSFKIFCKQFNRSWQGKLSKNAIIDNFVALAKEKEFDKKWVDAFLASMNADLVKNRYLTTKESLNYIYGSAEVIGLMMAKIMNLPEKSYQGARLLGRAMQQINFIRDIQEDLKLNRQYLPVSEMQTIGIKELHKNSAFNYPNKYKKFIDQQLNYYYKWQKEAESYFYFIPFKYRLAIQTASAMYKYTAKKINQNPFIVFDKKVKPSKVRIILGGFKQLFLIICSKPFQNTNKK